jgi:pimeloyl-ACP methyl ester carboxylesterase
MHYRYDAFSTQAFRDEPETMSIDGWLVNYKSFCRPENRHKTPLVILGGAFQHFQTFVHDVRAYLPHVPILLVALPGQASNSDPKDASLLSLRDLAGLLDGLFVELDLESVTVAGYSYGSLLAYTYAYHFEQRLEQLILISCGLELRHALKELIIQGHEQIHSDNMEVVSQGICQTLMNLNAREVVGTGPHFLERFAHQVKNLSAKDLADYRSNISRLVKESMAQRSFQVHTLIITAQYDHLFMPHESLEVARLFEQHVFVLIERGDHLVPLQSPQTLYRTILQFLGGEEPHGNGVLVNQQAVVRALERRKQPRYRVKGMLAQVSSPEGFAWEGSLEDISLDGAGLLLPKAQHLNAEMSGLQFPGFLRIQEGKAHFVFLKRTFADHDLMNEFVSCFQEQVPYNTLA